MSPDVRGLEIYTFNLGCGSEAVNMMTYVSQDVDISELWKDMCLVAFEDDGLKESKT